MEEFTFTRHQLYDLVWSKPISTLAKQYQVSGTELRKACKKMDIPLPNMGYWQKIQYNKPVLKIELPTNYYGIEEVTIKTIVEKNDEEIKESTIKTKLIDEIESNKKLPLKVPSKLKNPDPLIIKAEIELNGINHDYWSRNGLIQARSGFIDIKVAPKNFSRALRFLDALIKLLHTRGHEFIVKSDCTCAVVFGEEIKIRFQEKLRFEEKDNNYGWKSREYFPTGILTFRIWIHFIFHQKIWSDGKERIENQLSKILATMEFMALKEKEERVENEKIWAIEREKQLIFNATREQEEQDEANFKKLLKQSKKWNKVKILRAYITEVETSAIQKGKLTDDMKNWLKWAQDKVDLYDPLMCLEDKLIDESH
jgi:hypothetical protein